MKRRVLVASNRGPVLHEFAADGSLTGKRGGGGMIAGVEAGLAAIGPRAGTTPGKAPETTGATWICAALSEADRAVAHRPELAAPGADGVCVRMLDIPPDVFDRAYNNVANSALWFVHHLLFDTPNQPQFGAEFRVDWTAYEAYNEAFAGALAAEARPRPAAGDTACVLIQDYHLSLAPRMLRDRLGEAARDVPIAHFSHTPWAPPDYYRLLPDHMAAAVLDGMLGADHVGFHARRWADSFLDCCAAVLGAGVTRDPGPDRYGRAGRVRYRGRVTQVAVHPLGVDVPALRSRAGDDDVRSHLDAITRAAAGRKLIVRIDRTELSKNVVRGLAAYRELLRTRPQWQGQVVHLAFAYPSRSAVPEYRAYTDQVQRLAEEISAEFATPDWTPLILEVKDDYPRSLAACTLADVLLVNPIRDGMNLVAQEGPVLSESGCALVLSREAGAAATLAGAALLVNPYDVSETASALDRALTMPAAERQRRTAAVTEAASAAAPARWLGDQLAALQR